MLSREEIERRIPHAGRMCLLDSVLDWDEKTIRCRAISHRDTDNPLRSNSILSSVHGIEYAAQAGAVHGSLLDADAAARGGVLAAVRNVVLHQDRLDDLVDALTIEASRLVGGQDGWMYAFAIHCQQRAIVEGRFSVMFPD